MDPIQIVDYREDGVTYAHGPFVLYRMPSGVYRVGVQHKDLSRPAVLDNSIRELIAKTLPKRMFKGRTNQEKCEIVVRWLRIQLDQDIIIEYDGAFVSALSIYRRSQGLPSAPQ